MKLLTKEIIKQIPNRSEDSLEARVYVKFFHPLKRWTWYASEYDQESGIFFGWVKSGIDSNYDELGYWSLAELESVPAIERDINWNNKVPLEQVKRGEVS